MEKYNNEYKFSLTAGSLLFDEMVLVNQWLLDNDESIDKFQLENLGKERFKTSKREFAEIKIRMNCLSLNERMFLSQTTIENQRLLCYLSCVRSYRIFREFIDEVIIDKLSIFDYTISEYDYQKFFNDKADQNQKIDYLAQSTKEKVRQVSFRILIQTGILDSLQSKTIIKPFIDFSLQSLLEEDDLKYLLQ